MTRVRFGDFVLDGQTRELLRGGRAVHLSPKAFQLLETLVAERPRALSKDELHDRLWPDSFVVEANLANLVVEIRAALGEKSKSPRYLRTVQRFGYAFQAEAREAGPAATTPPAGPAFRLSWKGGRATLAEGEHVLGREPGADLLFDASTVSRRHARIRVSGDDVTIEDLESKNGTFVNDRRILEPTRLADADQIRLGSFRLTFRRRAPALTETAREP